MLNEGSMSVKLSKCHIRGLKDYQMGCTDERWAQMGPIELDCNYSCLKENIFRRNSFSNINMCKLCMSSKLTYTLICRRNRPRLSNPHVRTHKDVGLNSFVLDLICIVLDLNPNFF